MSTLYLPIGPPASGKSTLAAAMDLGPDAVVCPDTYRRILTGSVANQDANGTVFAITDRIVYERLKRGLDVWYDATNLVASWRDGPVRAARRWGADIVSVLMTANNATCRERNNRREQPVPDDVMDAMFKHRAALRISDLPGRVITDFDLTKKGFNL